MIARHRRDRKGKTLPLINTDDTDQKIAKIAEIAKNWKLKNQHLFNIAPDIADSGNKRQTSYRKKAWVIKS